MPEYQRHGVTKISHVISPEWIDLLRTGCETAQDEAGPSAEYLNQSTDEGIFFTDLEMARRLPVFAAFSMYSPVAAVAGTLMGSNTVRYLYDQIYKLINPCVIYLFIYQRKGGFHKNSLASRWWLLEGKGRATFFCVCAT